MDELALILKLVNQHALMRFAALFCFEGGHVQERGTPYTRALHPFLPWRLFLLLLKTDPVWLVEAVRQL